MTSYDICELRRNVVGLLVVVVAVILFRTNV